MRTKSFTCSECGEKCTSKIKLAEHMKHHAKTDVPRKRGDKSVSKPKTEHKCSTCEAVFTSVVLLRKHKNSCEAAAKGKPVKKRKSNFVEEGPVPPCEAISSCHEVDDDILPPNEEHESLKESEPCVVPTQNSSQVEKNASSVETDVSSKYSINTDAGETSRSSDIKGTAPKPKSTINVKSKVSKQPTKTQSESQVKAGVTSPVNSHRTGSPKVSKSQIIEPRVPCVRRTRQRNAPQNKQKVPPKTAENCEIAKVPDLQKSQEQNEHSDTTHNSEQKPLELSRLHEDLDVPVNQTLRVGRGKRKAPEKKEPTSSKVRKSSVLPKIPDTNENQKDFAGKRPSEKEVISVLITSPETIDADENSQQIDEPQSIVETEPCGQTQHDEDANSSDNVTTTEPEAAAEKCPPVEPKYRCTVCSKIFSKKYHLDRHLRLSRCSGMPPMTFSCQMCNRVYTRKDNLRQHLKAHTGEVKRKKNHKCTFCDKAFHGQSLLMIHLRKHTGEKPFACDFCPKKFPSAGALSKHRRTHTGEKPFECNECGQRFSLKGTLNRHLRVHSGVRPHVCTYCGKQFIQIGGLKAHLFYHTGENGFKCEECGKVFNRKARLQMHKLFVHEKHRPFVCEHCKKSFTRKEDLSRHVILHTGEKPFKCPTCNKSFAIKPSLKLHLLTHTKEEPRSCHECGRAFIRKDCFLRHMRKRHRDLLDKLLVDEKSDNVPEPRGIHAARRTEEDLCDNIQELLGLLVDKITLNGLGWPDKPIDDVLEAVIKRCGHTPVDPTQYSYLGRMRENAKLLFTVVIDDNAVKTLLNNLTVDEVILHVLRLAKT